MSLLVLLSAGLPAINTVALPGAQGADIDGIHGQGVKTPSAAAVAEATVGFDKDVHIPNGIILTIGLLSIILAIGIVVTVLLIGKTLYAEGAIPNEHISCAPPQTAKPIFIRPFFI